MSSIFSNEHFEKRKAHSIAHEYRTTASEAGFILIAHYHKDENLLPHSMF
jgi:predicted metallo-beta-lactamase superfamily hydrolase